MEIDMVYVLPTNLVATFEQKPMEDSYDENKKLEVMVLGEHGYAFFQG